MTKNSNPYNLKIT